MSGEAMTKKNPRAMLMRCMHRVDGPKRVQSSSPAMVEFQPHSIHGAISHSRGAGCHCVIFTIADLGADFDAALQDQALKPARRGPSCAKKLNSRRNGMPAVSGRIRTIWNTAPKALREDNRSRAAYGTISGLLCRR